MTHTHDEERARAHNMFVARKWLSRHRGRRRSYLKVEGKKYTRASVAVTFASC